MKLGAFLDRKTAKGGGGKDVTLAPMTTTDAAGRTVGLEDPDDPALRDDPAIAAVLASRRRRAAADGTTATATTPAAPSRGGATTIPTIAVPPLPANYKPSLTLLDSRDKPFIDPRLYGGRLLNQSASPVLGEPLNVIISALSSPDVLTRKGLQAYLRSLDFDRECLGLHSGKPQLAFLDPRSWQPELFLYRQVYTPFDHVFGTCLESLRGGNHVRAWQQQGSAAWFLAASREMPVTQHHMIVPDGYNVGRDDVLAQAQTNPQGTTSFMFTTYQTRVEYLTGLLPPGAEEVNHGIPTDGKVALLTVTIVNGEKKAQIKAERREANLANVSSDKKKKRLSFKSPFTRPLARPASVIV